MAEYIEKQAAIDALGEEPEAWGTDDEWGIGAQEQWRWDRVKIEAVPPADVRPVVLCKDCVYWDCGTIEMHDRCNNAEEGVDKTQVRFAECLQFSSWAKCMMMREDDYCSVGRIAIRGNKG